jgi:hypothetical protein
MSEAALPPATPAPPGRAGAMDELMLSMDVVDTLRHQESLVSRELNEDRREAELIGRLRDIYRSQGIEVPERILNEAVRSMKESRFVYKPPPPGLGVTLARLWVDRGRWGAALGAVAGVAVAALAAWWLLVQRPAQQAEERTRTELTQTLPADLDRLKGELLGEARTDDAKQKVEQLSADAAAAIRNGDPAAARQALSAMQALLGELKLAYQVMIVSRPGEQTGVFRIPKVNTGARNYYLVVEAIGPNGQPVPRTVVSEEDGKTATVTKWAVRVSREVYDAVARDKQDDGIVQNRRLGEKKRGALAIDWAVPMPPGTGGAILNW